MNNTRTACFTENRIKRKNKTEMSSTNEKNYQENITAILKS
jgi:hypothetical protein